MTEFRHTSMPGQCPRLLYFLKASSSGTWPEGGALDQQMIGSLKFEEKLSRRASTSGLVHLIVRNSKYAHYPLDFASSNMESIT